MDALGAAGGFAAAGHPSAQPAALQDGALGRDDLSAEGESRSDAAGKDPAVSAAASADADHPFPHLGAGATADRRVDRRGGGRRAGHGAHPARPLGEHGGARRRAGGKQTRARARAARAGGEAERGESFRLAGKRAAPAAGNRRRLGPRDDADGGADRHRRRSPGDAPRRARLPREEQARQRRVVDRERFAGEQLAARQRRVAGHFRALRRAAAERESARPRSLGGVGAKRGGRRKIRRAAGARCEDWQGAAQPRPRTHERGRAQRRAAAARHARRREGPERRHADRRGAAAEFEIRTGESRGWMGQSRAARGRQPRGQHRVFRLRAAGGVEGSRGRRGHSGAARPFCHRAGQDAHRPHRGAAAGGARGEHRVEGDGADHLGGGCAVGGGGEVVANVGRSRWRAALPAARR